MSEWQGHLLSCLCHCLFFGQVMSPHNSDQMSQRSQVSRVTLLLCFSKGLSVSEWVSEWVTRSPIELSAGQLKMWKYYLYVSEKLESFVHFHLFVWRINQNSWIKAKLSIQCLLLLAVSKVVILSHQASKWVYRDLGNPYQFQNFVCILLRKVHTFCTWASKGTPAP